MGTLAYCSPEQIAGKDLDNRSDIYSLGITMFEVLTGHIPIQAEPIRLAVGIMPIALKFLKPLTKSPQDYKSLPLLTT